MVSQQHFIELESVLIIIIINNILFGPREQSLQEVLEISFGVLKGSYLATFGQQLQTASSWQAAEAALFAIR